MPLLAKTLSRSAIWMLMCLCSVNALSAQAQKFEFAPVDKAELEMKDNPKQPGAHAMILEWRESKFDNTGFLLVYNRIKIFDTEGKKYGDIELPYKKDHTSIHDIKARTIHPDGTVIPFNGQIFDKLIIKDRRNKYHAKTFSMTDVQPGSLLEYIYSVNYIFEFDPQFWTLQRELFVRKASFRLNQGDTSKYVTRIYTRCLSQMTPHQEAPYLKDAQMAMDLTDIPAYEDESFSPPGGVSKAWMYCWYTDLDSTQPLEKFWKSYAKERFDQYEKFIGRKKSIEEEANRSIAAGDTSEQKLRKLYARAQQVRNLAFERDKTGQETIKGKLKDTLSVEDVLKHGYATPNEINELFVGLARAAGFDASMVQTSTRNDFFFSKESRMEGLLNDTITAVNLNGKDIYLDPATKYCPFGILNWPDTGVQGLKLTKDGGEWLTTPNGEARDIQRLRDATLTYTEGTLKGRVHITYKSTWALALRLDFLNEDETEQKHDLEEDAKSWFPQGTDVKLVKIENAKDPDQSLLVDLDIDMPAVGSTAGSRILVPMAIFQSNSVSPLRHKERKNDIYFQYPYSEVDNVFITLPDSVIVESVPNRRSTQDQIGVYDTQYSQTENKLAMRRTFAIYQYYYAVENYSRLHSFFDKVSLGDQDSAVLKEKQ